MLPILYKEINSYLDSLIAYIVISVFLTVMGLLIWVFPETIITGWAPLKAIDF